MATYGNPQVFISFHGEVVHRHFVSPLLLALKMNGVNVYGDGDAIKGVSLENIFSRIEESRIALVILSSRYTESSWCLDELVKITELAEQGKIVAIPIFYHLGVSDVKGLRGEFGENLKYEVDRSCNFGQPEKWMEALNFVTEKLGVVFHRNSDESRLILEITKHVKEELARPLCDAKSEVNQQEAGSVQNEVKFPASGDYKNVKLKILIRINMADEKARVEAMETAVRLKGVTAVEIKGDPSNQIEVTGVGVDVIALTSALRKKVALAELVSVNKVEPPKKPDGEKKDGEKKPDDKILDYQKPDNKKPEEKKPDDKIPDNQKPDKKKPEEKKPEPRPHGYGVPSSSPLPFTHPRQHQVFISFRGPELRNNFVSHLLNALKMEGVNVYIDEYVTRGAPLEIMFKRIEESRIALVIFSSTYSESKWCLDELVKIKECRDKGELLVIPIFYKVKPSEVEQLEGEFGINFWNTWRTDPDHHAIKWMETLESVASIMGIHWNGHSSEHECITSIVEVVCKEIVILDGESTKRESGEGDDTILDNKKPDKKKPEEKKPEPRPHGYGVPSSSPLPFTHPRQHQVFISFRGPELRNNFVSHLLNALKMEGVNVYIDKYVTRGAPLEIMFKRIEESRIALVIFSSTYSVSKWCLDELVKIKECMDEEKLSVIPIFFKVKPSEVKQLKGEFGVNFWNSWRINRDRHAIKWKETLESVASMKGIDLNNHGSEHECITSIVEEVCKGIVLLDGESTKLESGEGEKYEAYLDKRHLFGMEQRMEQLEKKIEFDKNVTRIVGVVGMPGIGKTTLAMILHEKWNCKFIRCIPLLGIRNKSKDHAPVSLRKVLLEFLLEGRYPAISDKTTHDSLKDELLQTKVFVILDDVSDKKQLEFLLGDCSWIKKGSKIVITTCDKSLLEGFSHDNYVVPALNNMEAFQIFSSHAFDDQICSPTGTFLALSRKLENHAQGHPLALKIMGQGFRGEDQNWEHKWEAVTKRVSTMFHEVWRVTSDQLNEKQKDVFLDIECFFKSEDEYFVRNLLDSGDPDSIGSVSEVKDLANKFLISITAGRVEINDTLYAIGKDLISSRWLRLCNHNDIINKLKKMQNSEANKVRGISLDMSVLTNTIYLDSTTFTDMHNLRYLKIYDSSCSGQCEVDCEQLCFPDGLELPLEEVRYLHWVHFPLEELPPDFRPENLVDLRLPYSRIMRVWEGVKETPRLKWVDLSNSNNLLDLSSFSKAVFLQRLNLEGCSSLEELPVEVQNMKSLVFLNLRRCIRLSFLPEMNLISLRTLVLSGCTSLKEFQLISESLEALHLDGTAITGFPLSIKKLQRLVLLNLKNCKMLKRLPNFLGELKALEELILSGCSNLENLSDIRESMKHLQSLRIDKIGAKEIPNISCITRSEGHASGDMVSQSYGPREWPRGVNGVCSLRRLCLSGNYFVSLQTDIGKLYTLNWLDVKQCKMLTSIPTLPPNLQYFDAYGCDSLERVANPLGLQVLSEQTHATFNFSNCNKLDQEAKDSIMSYTWRKSQLLLDAFSQYSGGSSLEECTGTCFPGWEVPAWFSHQAFGSVLKPTLPPHWRDNRFTGIGLCAVIQFPPYHEQRNRVLVKCNCEFKNRDGSSIHFSYTIGGWSEASKTPRKIESSHVFIGFTSKLDILNQTEKEDEEGCRHTEASFQFQGTDGTKVLEGYKVLKCGFCLVYPTDERDNISWDAKTIVNPERIEDSLGEERTFVDTLYGSHSGLIMGRDEEFFSEGKSDASQSIEKNFENERVDLLNEESEAEKEAILSSDHDNSSSGNLEKSKMHSLFGVELQLEQMSKGLGSRGRHTLWNYKDVIDKLTKMTQLEADNVSGIFLDMSEMTESIALDCMTFTNMRNLRYLKIYDSSCSGRCKADCNLYFPDDLELPLEEIQFLHWAKFPLEELPPDFKPENLCHLRLPYSKIERIWEGVKDAPRLKKVDLSHSSKLLDLSALSKAENIQRLNLEGCTSLDELPVEIHNMKSLTFLNLRGCVRLWSLPEMNLISLKTLILSDCSNLKEFQLISKSIEVLHLDGTAIKELPLAILTLQRLGVLNLKDCRMLECLPDRLGELKALEELILSGCSRLKNLSAVREIMKHLQSLLIDNTGAKDMPHISSTITSKGQASTNIVLQGPSGWPQGVNNVSSLWRLSLSGNDFVSLQPEISKLYNLKWLDVKQCKKLRFVPTLPPRLEYFDAHGCESLEGVANPLALPVLSGQLHATFNFSHCNKLEQDAKDNIMSYAQRRSQLVLNELTRYDVGFALEAIIGTCFPGWEVPAWFSHRASGSILEPKLPPHWWDNRFTGFGLCAVVQFPAYHEQRNRVQVKCIFDIKNEDGSSIRLSYTVGGWSKPSNASWTNQSSHVFIGFTSNLDIDIHGGEDDKEGHSHTVASFKFHVTDGTNVLEGCEVLKCGFSFLYKTDELQVEPGGTWSSC